MTSEKVERLCDEHQSIILMEIFSKNIIIMIMIDAPFEPALQQIFAKNFQLNPLSN